MGDHEVVIRNSFCMHSISIVRVLDRAPVDELEGALLEPQFCQHVSVGKPNAKEPTTVVLLQLCTKYAFVIHVSIRQHDMARGSCNQDCMGMHQTT